MEYNHIGSFLYKFKKILFQKEEVLVVVQTAIQKHTHIDIPITAIKLEGSKIRIQASPMIRSEIFIYRTKILDDINNSISPRSFHDIV